MEGGEISNNTTSSYGGGVAVCMRWNGETYVYGTFTMIDGKISGNTTTSYYSFGGGVYDGGTFTMEGGEIFGNSSYSGGGVGGSVYNLHHERWGNLRQYCRRSRWWGGFAGNYDYE
jgi:hypothetical protein